MSLHDVYVGLGSNLDNPIERVKEAWQRLKDLPFLSDFRLSKLYKTQPISPILQPDFINAVGFFKTGVEPEFLLGQLQEIEIKMGKKLKTRWDPRVRSMLASLRALIGKRLGDRPADAARRAGDDRHLAGEVEQAHIFLFPVRKYGSQSTFSRKSTCPLFLSNTTTDLAASPGFICSPR